jgi:hypothetical protein
MLHYGVLTVVHIVYCSLSLVCVGVGRSLRLAAGTALPYYIMVY